MTITHSNMFKKVMSYGCSFTYGGGLQFDIYYDWLDKYYPEKLDGYRCPGAFGNYPKYHSYPAILARFLNCEFENFARTCGSNELMFNYLYRTTYHTPDGTGILITLQPTYMYRMHLYDAINHTELRLNGHGGDGKFSDDIPAHDYHEMYMKYFYDDNYAVNQFMTQLNLHLDMLLRKNFTVIILPYIPADQYRISFLQNSNFCMDFDGYSCIMEMANDSKKRMTDLPDLDTDDLHMNEEGHRTVAESVYNHLVKYYNLRGLAL